MDDAVVLARQAVEAQEKAACLVMAASNALTKAHDKEALLAQNAGTRAEDEVAFLRKLLKCLESFSKDFAGATSTVRTACVSPRPGEYERIKSARHDAWCGGMALSGIKEMVEARIEMLTAAATEKDQPKNKKRKQSSQRSPSSTADQ